MFLTCKHTKLKTLVSSLALQLIKGISAIGKHANDKHVIESSCKIQCYNLCRLAISLLGIIGFLFLVPENLIIQKPFVKGTESLYLDKTTQVLPL